MRLTESIVKDQANYELVHGAYEKAAKNTSFWTREEFIEIAVDYNKAKLDKEYATKKALGLDIWGRKLAR